MSFFPKSLNHHYCKCSEQQENFQTILSIFWNFTLVWYRSDSPQIKRNLIASMTNLVCQLPNDLRVCSSDKMIPIKFLSEVFEGYFIMGHWGKFIKMLINALIYFFRTLFFVFHHKICVFIIFIFFFFDSETWIGGL